MNPITQVMTHVASKIWSEEALKKKLETATHKGLSGNEIFERLLCDQGIKFVKKSDTYYTITYMDKQCGWIDLSTAPYCKGWLDDKVFSQLKEKNAATKYNPYESPFLTNEEPDEYCPFGDYGTYDEYDFDERGF